MRSEKATLRMLNLIKALFCCKILIFLNFLIVILFIIFNNTFYIILIISNEIKEPQIFDQKYLGKKKCIDENCLINIFNIKKKS